jgi:translation initiation factor 3 subunit G
MSSSRWGRNWADLEEDDVVDMPKSKTRFETEVDSKGVKTVIEYVERDGKTYKVTKKIRQMVTARKVNLAVEERRKWEGFGRGNVGATDENGDIIDQKPVKCPEEIHIELIKKVGGTEAAQEQDAEEAFFEESINVSEELFKEKKVWTDINRLKQEERDQTEEKKPEESAKTADSANAPAGASGRYVPPSLRSGKGDGKGDNRDQEATLRVFNLSEDAKDGDLQELFGQFGRIQRLFLGKHMDTGQSKGFAFVTYYNRDDGERAIRKLNGHGYDNLIMKVEWAKPRT